MGIGDLWCGLSSDGRVLLCINAFENCEADVECEGVECEGVECEGVECEGVDEVWIIGIYEESAGHCLLFSPLSCNQLR